MLFACVYIPDFAVEAIVRVEAELREQAVAIVEGKPPLLHVIATNERARQLGIEIGMTQVQAQGYVASLELRRRSLLQEQAAHAALMDCACAISPRVHGEAPDTVLLDIEGLERLFGPPAKIARELARRAGELGMEANVGVAANVETAIHAARGFSGTTVIPRGREAERLAGLPVEILFDMREERAQERLDTLERWGVRTFRALALLPEVALAQRLGEAGVRLRKLARGEGARPLVPAEAPLEFEEAVELEDAIEMLDALMFVLNRMLEQLCTRLATRSLAAQELRLRMELEKHSAISIQHEGNFEFRISNSDLEKTNHGFSRIHTDTTEETLRRGSTRVDADEDTKHPPQRHRDTEEIGGSDHRVLGSSEKQANAKSEFRIQNSEIEIDDTGKFAEHSLKFPVPMRDTKVFLKLLQLELQARPPHAPVTKIWLWAEPARPRVTQGGLFVPEAPESERLEVTLARIAGVISGSSAHRVIWSSEKPDDGSARIPTDKPEVTVGRGSTRMDADEDTKHPPQRHRDTEQNFEFRISNFEKRRAADGDELRVGCVEVLDSHRPDAFRMKRFGPGQPASNHGFTRIHTHLKTEAVRRGSTRMNTDEIRQNPPGRHGGAEKIGSSTHRSIGSGRCDGVIALRRFRPPVAARVRVENGRPVRLQATDVGGEEHAGEIVWASGPWRESGEWWNEQHWSRDVWDVAVADETVAVYRIYCERGEWRVEGSYD